jgi:hypothetical protein
MRWELTRQAFGVYLAHGGAPTFGDYLRSIGLSDEKDEPSVETLRRTARIREKARQYA